MTTGAHCCELMGTKRRHVSRIGLGEDQSPLTRTFASKLNRNGPAHLEQFAERISTSAFFLRSNSRLQFIGSEISGAVEQMCELVIGACAPAVRGAPPLCEGLLYGFTRGIVASLAAHYFIEQRTVDREKCSALFRARRIVAI